MIEEGVVIGRQSELLLIRQKVSQATDEVQRASLSRRILAHEQVASAERERVEGPLLILPGVLAVSDRIKSHRRAPYGDRTAGHSCQRGRWSCVAAHAGQWASPRLAASSPAI